MRSSLLPIVALVLAAGCQNPFYGSPDAPPIFGRAWLEDDFGPGAGGVRFPPRPLEIPVDGWIGPEIAGAAARDDHDFAKRAAVIAETAPIGYEAQWRNSANGHYGSFRPLRDMWMKGRRCRDFQEVLIVQGRVLDSFGAACRQPDGAWIMVH